jgi:hypothetical protein
MLFVRVAWGIAWLLVLAAAILYFSDPTTAAWYAYIAAAMPLVGLILLRVLAIQKGRDEPAVGPGGGANGGTPFGPP